MFIHRSQFREIQMLIPGEPSYTLPWRWIAAVGLLFVLAVVSAL